MDDNRRSELLDKVKSGTLSERVARLEGDFYAGQYAAVDPSAMEEAYRAKQATYEKADPSKDCFEGSIPAYAFDEIIVRIKTSTERVFHSASKLETIGTRIMGQLFECEDEAKDAVRTEPDGTLDHALLALNRLDGSLARLETAALRMEML